VVQRCGPIDPEHEVQALMATPSRRNLFHHGEIVFRHWRLHVTPAILNLRRQPLLIDRQRIDVALVLKHGRDRRAHSNVVICLKNRRDRFD
jgi:hypothetical protein